MRSISAASIRISAPVSKSGAGISVRTSTEGSRMKAAVARQTSARLNEQMLLAIPTAMPWFAFTRIVGNVAGSSVGSSSVPS